MTNNAADLLNVAVEDFIWQDHLVFHFAKVYNVLEDCLPFTFTSRVDIFDRSSKNALGDFQSHHKRLVLLKDEIIGKRHDVDIDHN